MKKIALVVLCAVGLTACSDDDLGYDVSDSYGIPADVINNSIAMCANANSTFDRLYLSQINASYEYRTVNEKSVQYNYVQYDYTTRCASGAKFDVSIKFDRTNNEDKDATNITETTETY